MQKLHALGVNTKMFTGDKKEIAEKIARSISKGKTFIRLEEKEI